MEAAIFVAVVGEVTKGEVFADEGRGWARGVRLEALDSTGDCCAYCCVCGEAPLPPVLCAGRLEDDGELDGAFGDCWE